MNAAYARSASLQPLTYTEERCALRGETTAFHQRRQKMSSRKMTKSIVLPGEGGWHDPEGSCNGRLKYGHMDCYGMDLNDTHSDSFQIRLYVCSKLCLKPYQHPHEVQKQGRWDSTRGERSQNLKLKIKERSGVDWMEGANEIETGDGSYK